MRISSFFLVISIAFFSLASTSEAAKPTWSIGTTMDYVLKNPEDGSGLDIQGILLHYNTESNWGFGYEEHKISSRDDASAVQVYMLDLQYNFELPLINLTLGTGLGTVAPNEFMVNFGYEDSPAAQIYIQLGLSFGQLDFHVSSHNIKSTVNHSTPGQEINLDGELMAIGFSAKF